MKFHTDFHLIYSAAPLIFQWNFREKLKRKSILTPTYFSAATVGLVSCQLSSQSRHWTISAFSHTCANWAVSQPFTISALYQSCISLTLSQHCTKSIVSHTCTNSALHKLGPLPTLHQLNPLPILHQLGLRPTVHQTRPFQSLEPSQPSYTALPTRCRLSNASVWPLRRLL